MDISNFLNVPDMSLQDMLAGKIGSSRVNDSTLDITPQIQVAILVILDKYSTGLDKLGRPKWKHPLEVYNQGLKFQHYLPKKAREDFLVTCLLHDVVEDGLMTPQKLLDLDFSGRSVRMIELLNKDIADEAEKSKIPYLDKGQVEKMINDYMDNNKHNLALSFPNRVLGSGSSTGEVIKGESLRGEVIKKQILTDSMTDNIYQYCNKIYKTLIAADTKLNQLDQDGDGQTIMQLVKIIDNTHNKSSARNDGLSSAIEIDKGLGKDEEYKAGLTVREYNFMRSIRYSICIEMLEQKIDGKLKDYDGYYYDEEKDSQAEPKTVPVDKLVRDITFSDRVIPNTSGLGTQIS